MKPSDQAKASGLKNMKELCELLGHSRFKMNEWAKNNPELFAATIQNALNVKKERK